MMCFLTQKSQHLPSPKGNEQSPTGQPASRGHDRHGCGRRQKLEAPEQSKINSIHFDIS